MEQESYIQYLGGYSKENVNIEDIKTALADLQNMDDEHGAFWVSVTKNEENILETQKDLKVIGVFEQDLNVQYQRQCKDLHEIENLYSLLLNENFIQLRKQLDGK